MSSSQAFTASSPESPRSNRRRKSRFTFKHLSQLALSSTSCPLRVIAHIDLDAFYAQCEGVRLGVPEDQPLAVQQWQGLIAINYPARKYGLSRHVTISEAQKACPEIIVQHVATWREGDEKWAYHEDAAKHIATHKVSLDPYRLESRRILAVIKETLPAAPVQRVEKASIDEVFLDLSAQVHALLLERYPELKGPPPYDDPTENLPAPPTTALDWNADALVDLDADQTEEEDPDWDDIAMLIGSEIVRMVRAEIRERLKYTCSAGVARNKMLAKIGSGHKKPNQQTIVRNRAVQHFLGDLKFTKIRMLGGKLGDEIVSMFNMDTVKDLLEVPLEQLKRLGDDTGSWLHQTIRGEDHSEVNPRTQIKSMLSAKSFRPSINSLDQALKWLRIFVADIFTRLVEEGVTENRRRPKTINLHHRQAQQTRSKQAPIPPGKAVDEPLLLDLAKTLLAQVVAEGRAWPCSNLSLSVGGFEDGVTGNKGIGGFLVRGDEAKALQQQQKQRPPVAILHDDDHHHHYLDVESGRPEKRRRIVADDDKRINQFFTKRDTSSGAQHTDDAFDFEHVSSAQQHSTGDRGPREDAQGPELDADQDIGIVDPVAAAEDSFVFSSLPETEPPPKLFDEDDADEYEHEHEPDNKEENTEEKKTIKTNAQTTEQPGNPAHSQPTSRQHESPAPAPTDEAHAHDADEESYNENTYDETTYNDDEAQRRQNQPNASDHTLDHHGSLPQHEHQHQHPHHQAKIETYLCPRCAKTMLADQRDEHADFHFALDLQRGDGGAATPATAASTTARAPLSSSKARAKVKTKDKTRGNGGGGGGGSDAGVEKGQRRLAFGR